MESGLLSGWSPRLNGARSDEQGRKEMKLAGITLDEKISDCKIMSRGDLEPFSEGNPQRGVPKGL